MLSKDKIIEYFKFFEDELILPIREKLNIHIGYPGITLVAPCNPCKPGTVAVIINDDGTITVIRKSVANDGKIYIP